MASFFQLINNFVSGLLGKRQQRERQPVQSSAPIQEATPTPAPLQQQIRKGLEGYAPDSPLLDYSSQLADVGQGLPHKALPAALAIKESSALRDIPGNERMREFNNPFGISPPGGLAQYPDIKTSIVGGGERDQKGLKGVLGSGAYDKYLESGELEDFLNVYTPSGEGNRGVREQIEELQTYLDYFKENLSEEKSGGKTTAHK